METYPGFIERVADPPKFPPQIKGTALRETVEVPEGEAERPISRASLERKFRTFAVPVVGAERATEIAGLVDRVDGLADMRELTRALTGPGKQGTP